MKTIITLAALALTPVAASAESAAELFALSNDSAAERIVSETSIGDVDFVQGKFALNESPAEMNLNQASDVTRGTAAQAFFALNNDSAAERIVR
jgi:hypothetical protein